MAITGASYVLPCALSAASLLHGEPGTVRLMSAFPSYHCTRKTTQSYRTLIVQINCNIATSGEAGTGPVARSGQVTEKTRGASIQQADATGVVIRGAHLGDLWDVADTHCGAFFPDTNFPLDFILRGDRAMAMLANLSLPAGQKRKCLVAVETQVSGRSRTGGHLVTTDVLRPSGSHSRISAKVPDLIDGKISGAATVDTLAEYLPRRMPKGQRRTGIAYVSNVAVRQQRRRRGIAQKLIREAEKIAKSWGCRSIALHCDMNNPAAAGLYLGEGYRLIKAPKGALWPRPKAVPESNFQLMMKRLSIL